MRDGGGRTRSSLGRLVGGVVLLALAVLIGSLVTWIGQPPFDAPLLREGHALRDGAPGEVFRTASDVGYGSWLVPVGAILAVVLVAAGRPRWRLDALVLAAAPAVAVAVTRVLKELFDRPRPAGAPDAVLGYSMPSGHATSSAAFAVAIALLARGRWGVALRAAALLFALTVGASRVVLGVHYPSDVLAGWCSGAGIALVVSGALHRADGRGARAAR